MVELKGKEEGVIFDSTRKQIVHFKTVDEVEEFIFYIENIMAENNPQEKEKWISRIKTQRSEQHKISQKFMFSLYFSLNFFTNKDKK